jgi:hypothetical protein
MIGKTGGSGGWGALAGGRWVGGGGGVLRGWEGLVVGGGGGGSDGSPTRKDRKDFFETEGPN